MVITTKFNILDKVEIDVIDVPARVLSVKWDGIGIVYELEYWWEGNIKTVYLYEDELK